MRRSPLRQAARLLSAAVRREVDDLVGGVFSAEPRFLQLRIGDDGFPAGRGGASDLAASRRSWMAGSLSGQSLSKVRYLELELSESAGPGCLAALGDVAIEALAGLRDVKMCVGIAAASNLGDEIVGLCGRWEAKGVACLVSVLADGSAVLQGEAARMGRASAGSCIERLQQSGLPVEVLGVVTAANCYWADDLLRWCEEQGVRWTFRLGAAACGDCDATGESSPELSPEQSFHVAMFFDKVSRHRSADLADRLYYRETARRLSLRTAQRPRCAWPRRGLAIDGTGSRCACPSLQAGATLGPECPIGCWRAMLPKAPTLRELLGRGGAVASNRRRVNGMRPVAERSIRMDVHDAERDAPRQWRHVLVTGWYGTETTGDKAILGGLLDFLAVHAPACRITLTTLDDRVSRQTQRELPGHENATLLPMAKGCDPAVIDSVDAVIVGGGPLMEIPQMEYIRRMFAEANRRRKGRIVFGCGVGPLHSEEMRLVTGEILRLTTAGFLRDKDSYDCARQLAPGHVLRYSCDPAIAYLRKRYLANGPGGQGGTKRIAGLLRANTTEFRPAAGKRGMEESNRSIAALIAAMLETAGRTTGACVDLLAMNAPWIGGDDRLFNRLVERSATVAGAIRAERSYQPLGDIVESLRSADVAVAMRYHGHLFCLALGIPFLSIDYTGRAGKVGSLVRRIGFEEFSAGWDALDVQGGAARLQRLLREREHWAGHLRRSADAMVGAYQATCKEVFHTEECS